MNNPWPENDVVIALFVDGPKHGLVFRNIAWPGLTIVFPVPTPVSVHELWKDPPIDLTLCPQTIHYRYWGRMGNVRVYKFERVHLP